MIGIHGAGGKLGALICKEASAVSLEHAPLFRSSSLTDELLAQISIIIDVSSAEGLEKLLAQIPAHLPLLVGTTGALPWSALEQHARTAPVAVVPNFSVGIPLLLELLELAINMVPEGWDIEVVEAHHNQKKDAPSGTAKRIVHTIQQGLSSKGEKLRSIPTHSLRVGDTFGEHTVWLSGPGERIELTHIATRREVFALGALRWSSWLLQQDPFLFRP
jgi:4-hydroxy-tetrahydrodipicolinate reductase